MKDTTKKEIAKKEPQKTELTPADLLSIAVQQNADLDKLEKLMDLQARWEASKAKKAYHVAMTAFKANPPEIKKDKKVSYAAGGGTTSYKHASLANVVDTINGALSTHGLSASWQTAQNGAVSVTCRITHVLGHSEETTLTAGADGSGSKNSIQAIGSTITYLQRYTLLALTGLAAGDQDDDGRASEAVYINEKQQSIIADYVVSTNTDMVKMLDHFKLESLEKMTSPIYNKALAILKQREADQKKETVVDVETEGVENDNIEL